MKLNKKIVATSSAVIAVLVLIILFIFGTIKSINGNYQTFLSQKREVVMAENKIKDLENFGKEYKINQGELGKIDDLFVKPQNPSNLIEFLGFIRKTATDSEVAINVSAPSQNAGDPFPYLIFQISGNGKFINFMKFLEKLENSPYLTEVTNLLVVKTKNEKEKNLSQNEINFNLSLKTLAILEKNE